MYLPDKGGGFMQCCGSGPFFFGSGFSNTDPDPGDPKRPDPTGSGSYLDMFLMISNINIFYGFFLPNPSYDT